MAGDGLLHGLRQLFEGNGPFVVGPERGRQKQEAQKAAQEGSEDTLHREGLVDVDDLELAVECNLKAISQMNLIFVVLLLDGENGAALIRILHIVGDGSRH